MRIALDATYSVGANPSGIAAYSRALLSGLAASRPEDEFIHCYRLKQWASRSHERRANVRDRPLIPPLPTFRAGIFHALNQRVDSRPAPVVISTFHDLFVMSGEYSSPEFRARFTEQARLAARRSDFIIAVSRFTGSQVETLLNFPAARIRVVPHGISVHPGANRVAAREKTVLFVGAVQKRKNVAGLAEAFAALPTDWRLIIAGSPSGYGAAEILDGINGSRAHSRIEVLGYVPSAELPGLYSRASVFAFPSLAEGFGMPVLEAMAHGTPVLTSRSTALAEIAGNAALLVDPNNVDEIAAGLQRLAFDEDLRRDLISRGRERANEFSWERACDATYQVYREALGPGSA